SQMAVGTGFVQLFRGLGQVSGVGVASALFQYTLSAELRKRIHGPGADQLINKIRHSATLVASLPLETQRAARDSYAIALRAVFIMAAFSTAVAFIVRLPVSPSIFLFCSDAHRARCFRFPRNPSIISRPKNRCPLQRSRRGANGDDTR
ncbi:hypothetical protein EDB84DRAFT_1269187, partial [Lactarius hengduanensis]